MICSMKSVGLMTALSAIAAAPGLAQPVDLLAPTIVTTVPPSNTARPDTPLGYRAAASRTPGSLQRVAARVSRDRATGVGGRADRKGAGSP